MAIKRIQFPDGSIKRVEVPDDATDEQILQFVQSQSKPAPKAERIDPNAGMSRLDKLIVGAGRGFTELGQGVKQLGLNAGAAVGLVDDADAEAYNRQVADEAALYERNLGDDGWATAGRIGSQVVATAPAGAIGIGAKGATALRTAGKVAGYGAATGAGTAALNPVTEGPYWQGKAKQAAVGAAAGGALSGTGSLVTQGIQRGVNAPRQLINAAVVPQAPVGQAPANKLVQIVSGTPSGIRRGDRVAQSTGISLTPGQRSGGKAMTMMENVARGSVWTRDRMFAGDQARARQMLNAIRSTARDASPAGASPEAFATNLQGTVRKMTGDLADARSAFGRQAYGAVENAAGGARVVQTNATLDEIAKIVDEFGDVQGADATAIARQAEAFFNKLKGDGSITPGLAVRQLQAWEKAARTGSGLFDGVQDRSTAKTLAGRLSRALLADLDDTATNVGGSLGDSLRAANAGWRQYSQQIDALEASALGRMVGDDFVDAIGGNFNAVSPEKVWQKLDGLSPTELESVKSYITKANPELWGQYQRLVLERARDVARQSAPSSGAHTLGINPGAFVKALEGSSGQKAVDMQKRLSVIFGGSPTEARVGDILEAGRRMADTTGYNFSGTAGASELMAMPGLLGRVTEGAKAAGGALGPLFGLQGVARAASTPINARQALPMYQMGRLGQFLGQAPAPVASNQLSRWLLQQDDPAAQQP